MKVVLWVSQVADAKGYLDKRSQSALVLCVQSSVEK